MTTEERKRQQAEMRSFCQKLREEIYEQMGRPNKVNLRHKFRLGINRHRHADLVRLYFALGYRIEEIDKAAAEFRRKANTL